MMACKKALTETEGDFEAAQDLLRKEMGKAAEKKAGRATGEGLVQVRLSDDHKTGTMLIVLCETEPVVKTPMFREFVSKVADKAHEAGATDEASVLALAWDDGQSATVEEALKALIGLIGENMKIGKVARLTVAGEGRVGAYVHHNEKEGALVALSGSDDFDEAAKELGMHIVFAKPIAMTRDEIPAEEVEKELGFLKEQLAEDPKMAGKPEQALKGILEGRLNKNFFGQKVLTEQGWFRDGGDTLVKKHLEEWGATLDGYALFHIGA
jgi:elongation factor Ts